MIDIAKARALCAAATPGPWTFTTCYGVATVEHGPDRDAIAHAVDYLQVGDEYDNASFIASARTLLPEALTEIERVYTMNARVNDRLSDLTATLEKIAYAGSDCPPARELEAFYRSQLHYCIGTAARALTPAAGGEDV